MTTVIQGWDENIQASMRVDLETPQTSAMVFHIPNCARIRNKIPDVNSNITSSVVHGHLCHHQQGEKR